MQSDISTSEDARAAAEAVRVLWRPGCSSCARVKEFLTQQGVDYVSVDITQEPAAVEELRALGVRSVPVVVRGAAFTFAQSLDDVSAFLGLSARAGARLPPSVLVARWREVLQAARVLVARVPPTHWRHVPVAGGLSLQAIGYHIFRIPVSFLDCVEHGDEDWVANAMLPPSLDLGPAGLAEFAGETEARLAGWWAALDDKSCAWPVRKYDGVHSAHLFLERQTWHSAHHTRQLESALSQLGVDVAGVIDPAIYFGLPMPERVW